MHYKTSIQKNRVKVVSEAHYQVVTLPTKWEVLEEFDSFGNAKYSDYSLQRAMEKREILAFKIEIIDD